MGSVVHLIVRRNGEGTSAGHRITGIDTKIHQDLFQLRCVRRDGPQIRNDLENDTDGLGKCSPQDSFKVDNQAAGIQRDSPSFDPAGKHQDLFHEICAPFRARFKSSQSGNRTGVLVPVAQELNAHHDRGQHIVEVMGDAAGEAAETLQALRS